MTPEKELSVFNSVRCGAVVKAIHCRAGIGRFGVRKVVGINRTRENIIVG